jgi:AcrR family transcriptional regulator
MSDLAEAVHLTKGALYHYFPSKTDLLYEIYVKVVDEISDRLSRHPEEGAPEDLLKQAMRDVLEVIDEMPLEVSVYFQEGPLLSEFLPRAKANELKAREAQFVNRFVEILELGRGNQSFRDTDPVASALAVIGMVSWASRWYQRNGRLSLEELSELFASIALHGLSLGGPILSGQRPSAEIGAAS